MGETSRCASVAVIGGGIVGRSIALQLAARGIAVTLIDLEGAGAASWGNAGHIATEQVVPLASPATLRSAPRRLFLRGGPLALPPAMARSWLPFALRLVRASSRRQVAAGARALGSLLCEAAPAWRRLGEAIGAPGLVALDGHEVAWESARSADAGRRAWAQANTGTARPGNVDAAGHAALRRLSPAVVDAIRFVGTGRITDLDQLAHALDGALARAGVTRVAAEARLHRAGDRIVCEGVEADGIVVAAGIGSRDLIRAIGWRVPMIAERGYHVRFAPGDWPADRIPLVFEDRSMIVTRYADCVQAAGFVEFSRVDAPADPRKWQRLEAHVAALRLPVGPVVSRWMGARPTLPDYLPAIGRAVGVDNLFYAFGHQHLGLTMGPVTGEVLGQLIGGETPAIDLTPFALERLTGPLP
ncbi:NAD(P)/FAD-dependent oxidoreductase [Sphingomonas beigongshangi]|uniref:NAD(P)/FAD-dependent oxidoreductase n=1 Tax=Sphingomonas beigongshangi TaxID=2782540 RepID=UPI00193BA41A|nr:FAD-dependent oxidoreductase [Sphingomonas beigongshangi]